MAVIRQGTVAALGPGPDVVLGPLCMENDRLTDGVALPPELEVGDLVVICDAGAYDASMTYRFGRGGMREARTSDAG
jgi:diaminopimelate decarboxylase